MSLQIFQVDAFADELFQGNPAAVIPLNHWLSDDILQKIAMENNLSETAFFVPDQDKFKIRWFTPLAEVELCGHATLATAHVLFNHLDYKKETIEFYSKSGVLKVFKKNSNIYLDFPSMDIKQSELLSEFTNLSGSAPLECWRSKDDYMLVYEKQEHIEKMTPNFHALMQVDCRGIIVTAPGDKFDFVSRFFAPKVGINEDPATGSAHTKLIPYWANKLNKSSFIAAQLSKRSGIIYCENKDDRVYIGGKAVTFSSGIICEF